MSTTPRIGLDIDGVLADFVSGIIAVAKDIGYGADFPGSWLTTDRWNFSPKFGEVWKLIENEPDFWLGLKPHPGAALLTFRPVVFITARPIESSVTMAWLARNNLLRDANQIVHTTPPGGSKVEAIRLYDVDYFVDDNIPNWNEINQSGAATCFLMDRPWNRSVDARLTRIRTLDEVPMKILEGGL